MATFRYPCWPTNVQAVQSYSRGLIVLNLLCIGSATIFQVIPILICWPSLLVRQRKSRLPSAITTVGPLLTLLWVLLVKKAVLTVLSITESQVAMENVL